MGKSLSKWVFLVLGFLVPVLLSLRNPKNGGEADNYASDSLTSSPDRFNSMFSVFLQSEDDQGVSLTLPTLNPGLQYDYYRETCPQAETIVRSTIAQIYSEHSDISAGLLRLFFHDCFIKGCDASVLLDDSNGNKSHLIESQAVPSKSLRGFDEINLIKEELEKACPAVVSCADTLALATRDSIVLAGSPFYPVFTGRRDSAQSYFKKATEEIPRPDGNLTETLGLFGLRGFNEKETVALLGGHNIGNISCRFLQNRLFNFLGTGLPDPTIASDFLSELRTKCAENNISTNDEFSSPMRPRGMTAFTLGIDRGLLTSISSGAGFDAHYYQSLLKGRGLLFADQQLMSDENTARYVRIYASDDGSTFRREFSRAMVKMSNLDVLTSNEGQVRTNCSLPVNSA